MIDGGEAIRKLALNVVRYTGLEPDYYPAQIAWLRAHSGS